MNFKIWLGRADKMTHEHSIFDLAKVIDGDLTEDMVLLRGTGITDKNGKEIFEHDVLRGSCYPYQLDGKENYVAVMDWIYNSWQIVSCKVSDRVRGASDGINEHVEDQMLNDFEVIGNLYETKEFKGLYK
ncbi:MAG: hypothetical protein J5I64_13140 [Saprospiraceae bacterium]|nr:hypothetical protein [Saprospiraceae bacterium]